MKTESFTVKGMTCAACVANVTRAVSKIDGVSDVNVNLLSGKMCRVTSFAAAKMTPTDGCYIPMEHHVSA